MEQEHDANDHYDESESHGSAADKIESTDNQEEISECISLLRQLLDDVDMNTVSKYSLMRQLKEECDEEWKIVVEIMSSISSEYQAISNEIDRYIVAHRPSKQGATSHKNTLDSVFLVDTPLASLIGKQECSGREAGN